MSWFLDGQNLYFSWFLGAQGTLREPQHTPGARNRNLYSHGVSVSAPSKVWTEWESLGGRRTKRRWRLSIPIGSMGLVYLPT